MAFFLYETFLFQLSFTDLPKLAVSFTLVLCFVILGVCFHPPTYLQDIPEKWIHIFVSCRINKQCHYAAAFMQTPIHYLVSLHWLPYLHIIDGNSCLASEALYGIASDLFSITNTCSPFRRFRTSCQFTRKENSWIQSLPLQQPS